MSQNAGMFVVEPNRIFSYLELHYIQIQIHTKFLKCHYTQSARSANKILTISGQTLV